MKKKSTVAIITIIALSSFVVLGSSPGLVNQIFASIQENPITRIFARENQPESEKPRVINYNEIAQQSSVPEPTTTEVSAIPEAVLYESVFRMIILFNQEDAKSEAVTDFRSYFKNEAKLSSQDDELLTQTANNYSQEIKIIDEQAEIIIDQLRQQFPVGSLPEGQLIQPTSELLKLQEQRNQMALHYKHQLRDLMGEDKFIEFDKFVQGSFASGFRAIPLSSIQDSKGQGGVK